MTARVTQQLLVVGYKTNPEGRVSSVAIEVARPTVNAPPASSSSVHVIVVAS